MHIHGRRSELAALTSFIDGSAGSQTLVLTGVPGAGKTRLWEAGCALAGDRRRTVLVARARDAEASLPFARA